jgi:hypothetical protein
MVLAFLDEKSKTQQEEVEEEVGRSHLAASSDS